MPSPVRLAAVAAVIALAAPIRVAGAQSVGSSATDSSAHAAPPHPATGRRARARAKQPANRAALQRQVRQALARVTRERLGLNDAQMSQLADVDRNFQPRRQSLTRDEAKTRRALADAMADSTSPDQAKIGGYLDHLLALQRQRLDLQQDEQKALSAFLTPLQRAQYQALQERMRRRLDQFGPGGQGQQPGRRRQPPR
jgi:Spy/CpxP family protein refolding chaperone